MGGDVLDWLMENVMPWVVSAIVILVVLALVSLPFVLWAQASAPSFTLTKAEWACTAAHTETSTTYIKSGAVMVPIQATSTVCDTYTRR